MTADVGDCHDVSIRHKTMSEEGDRPEFRQRQMEYFNDLLVRKWECDTPGHGVCLCTADGKHHIVSEAGVAEWVDAMCQGTATPLQPPSHVLTPIIVRGRTVDGLPVCHTVPFIPSRPHRRSSSLAVSASLREKLQLSTSLSSLPSSGVPGIGYYSGKAIKWIGERSLGAVDDLVIFKRTVQYHIWLEEWEKNIDHIPATTHLSIGADRRQRLFKILEDTLEMSRPCYAKPVNAFATALGCKIIDCMDSASNIPLTEETATLFSHIHCCLSILDLTRDIRVDQCDGDLAEELLHILTKVPLALQGEETVSATISLLAKELAFAHHTSNHRWLGYHLGCIVNRTMQVRPLTLGELGAIRDLAFRRLNQSGDDWIMVSRPWEVLLFLDCSSQLSWFSDIIFGPQGLQSLLIALEAVLWRADLHDDEQCAHLDDVLRVLWILSPQFADIMGFAPGIVDLLLRAFSRCSSDEWFHSRCWIIRIIRQLVSHRPQLFQALVRNHALATFEHFVEMPTPQGLNNNDKRFRREAIEDARALAHEMTVLNS